MKRIYLSGPMSGLPDLNFPAFKAAAEKLRAAGFEVVNPAELNPIAGSAWADCMRVDIKALLDCDAIVLLDGWEHSRGAKLELHVALALGMTVQALAVALALARELAAGPGPGIIYNPIFTGTLEGEAAP